MKPCYLNCLCVILYLGLAPKFAQSQTEPDMQAVTLAIFQFQDLDNPNRRLNTQGNVNRSYPSDPSVLRPSVGAPDDGFRSREEGSRGREGELSLGQKVSALLFAELAVNPSLVLVERDELEKATDELELSLSGIIDPAKANQIGRMIGARVLISGTVMKIDSNLYVIAKIIGTETSRVLGASAKGEVEKGIDPLVAKVAEDIGKIISERANELLPKVTQQADRIAAIQKKIGNANLPSISIKILEQHINRRVLDPAAESELVLICRELGFTILDGSSTEGKKADLILSGEGVAEYAVRRKNLVAVKARLEMKVLDNSSKKVLASDRQTIMSVDLTEQIAGKAALQQAALEIAERLIPKMIEERKKLDK